MDFLNRNFKLKDNRSLKFCSFVFFLLFLCSKAVVFPFSAFDYGPAEARWVKRTIAKMTLVKDTSRILPLSSEKKLGVFSLSSDPGDYYAGRPFKKNSK